MAEPKSRGPVLVASNDLAEINRALAQLVEWIDELSGLRGNVHPFDSIDTTDDVIVDLATSGVVLKDTQARPHYWRVTVNTSGSLVTTDLGISKP